MALTEGEVRPKSYKERAERIENRLADNVEFIHSRIDLMPRVHFHKLYKEEEKLDPQYQRLHRLAKDLSNAASSIELNFRQIPPGYYLELEVSHNAFMGISDYNFPFVRKERERNTIRYYVDCGIFVGNNEGRSVVYVTAGIPGDKTLLSFLKLNQAGTKRSDNKYVNLNDVLNAKVKQNTEFRKKQLQVIP